jgi:hypothetical protein
VFWVQNWFFGQKNLEPNFSTTTVARIWAKQTTCHLNFKKNEADDMSSTPGAVKKKGLATRDCHARGH